MNLGLKAAAALPGVATALQRWCRNESITSECSDHAALPALSAARQRSSNEWSSSDWCDRGAHAFSTAALTVVSPSWVARVLSLSTPILIAWFGVQARADRALTSSTAAHSNLKTGSHTRLDDKWSAKLKQEGITGNIPI
ncbi:hypothetical protein T484DRAFT_1917983 [Baffinella frigidus]|nr:hypothetical protein T484DRAFT_1917983 [Cryptophyta sp. CCMP2293]